MALAILGEVEFDAVFREQHTKNNQITDKNVEGISNVSDHINVLNGIFEIEGKVVEDAPRKLEILRGYSDNSNVLRYVGRNIVQNVVIQDFSSEHIIDNRTGFNFTMVLRMINFAIRQSVDLQIDQTRLSIPRAKQRTRSGRQGTNVPSTEQLQNVITRVANLREVYK